MRKSLLLLILCVFVGSVSLWAQTKTITGKITGSDDGLPIPGAAIMVKGTSVGTVTNADGVYSLQIPDNATTLWVSYMGMKTQEVEIQGRTTINVALQSDTKQVDEVVVTALGISREKKALGYAVTDVKSDEISKSRGGVNNPINALAGKVAGLQITGSSGNLGGSSKVLIRGVKSISGNNQPLFVIDGVPIEGTDFNSTNTSRGAGGYDYGNLIQDINPDDVESISVLKGPNASALYGSRATNGVVMITTKKGKVGSGLGVSFNSSVGFETVNKLPKRQNEYGGGGSMTFAKTTINGVEYLRPGYNVDESWGPRYEGQQVLSWYDLAKWEEGGKIGNPTTSEWRSPVHDVEDFFELGYSFTNNLSISQSNENAAVRASYTNTVVSGYMPNSRLEKNAINVNATAKGKGLYELFANVTYLNQKAKGRSETGYGDNNVMQKFFQWGQRQLDMKELKDLYKFSDGTQATWNRTSVTNPKPKYSNNPYWTRYENYQNDTRDRLYGNSGVKLNILKSLTAQYKFNLDFFSDKQYERNAVNSQEESRYYEAHRQQFELNHEIIVQYNQKFDDISVNATAGGNLMYQQYRRLTGESQSGLILPNFYSLANSKSPALAENYLREKATNSVFGSVSLGYGSFAFLDATLRNDWSSTLPQDNNSYLYPSVTGSFVFSELLTQDWMNFGKFRVGWAKVGNDTDPYRVLDSYAFYSTYGAGGFINSLSKKNPNLKPESTYSFEVGLEFSFLDNRIGFDGSYYSSTTKDQILPLTVSGSTGYTSTVINAGEVENKGYELLFKGVPIRSGDFEWNTTLTLSGNKNKVNELIGDVSYYRLTNAPFKVEIGAIVGEQYGEIMGTDFVYLDGKKVVDENGEYISTNGNQPLGSVYPDMLAGFMNTLKYKNVELSILFDAQWGGKFFSTTHMWGMYSGIFEETAGLNDLGNPKRNPVTNDSKSGGVLIDGVFENGKPNDVRIDAMTWANDHYSGPAAQNIFKSDFIKLRELTIGYTLPLKNQYVRNVKISAYGRNLAIWGPDTKHFDPESATTNSGNIQGLEGGALPSVATFGFNVGLQF